jgi:hypothetical protein
MEAYDVIDARQLPKEDLVVIIILDASEIASVAHHIAHGFPAGTAP